MEEQKQEQDKEYIFDQFDIDYEIERLQQQYELFMERM